MASIIRTGTSRGAHVRALWRALLELEELLPLEPNTKRVALRNHRKALERAYPGLLGRSEVDELQQLAEEDGEDVEEPTEVSSPF